MQAPPLVSKVVELEAGNIRICIDWHDTLDQALNGLGFLDKHLVEKFRRIVRVSNNQVEFHIVSYAGYSKLESTDRAARHLIDNLNSQGIPFKDVRFSRRPCGPEGESSIVCTLKAHAVIDDRPDVLTSAVAPVLKSFEARAGLIKI